MPDFIGFLARHERMAEKEGLSPPLMLDLARLPDPLSRGDVD
jgi:hypothetical protein